MSEQSSVKWDPETGAGLRILIVRIGAMGDVLHALPAVSALRRMLPQAWIGWVIEPRWLPLLRAGRGPNGPEKTGGSMPLVDAVYLAPTKNWKKRPFTFRTLNEIAKLRREIRNGQFHLCVDMQGSIRSAVIGRMAGAKLFAGPAQPRERPAAWLYGRRAHTKAEHVVEQGGELLGGATGLKLASATLALPVDLPVDADAEGRCAARLRAVGVADARFVLIVPSAGWGAKQWPADRYGHVAAALARQGYRVLVNAYSDHDALANAVVSASGGTAQVFACDIAEMIALTRRAALVIAGDTGPLHLAAAMGRPVVALFGPTDPFRNGPYGTQSKILRRGAARRDHRRLSDPEAGLLAITIEDVVEAANELLAATKRPSGR